MRILITILCVLSSILLFGQHSISGKVTNADGEPLAQASVFVVESQYATITDDDGNFLLTDLENGEHTLKASYVGYKSYEDYIVLNDDVIVNINLGNNNLYLNAVDISTNRVSENSAFAAITFNKKDVEKDNLGQDVPYLLRWTPSAVVTSDAGTGIGYTGLRIRGTDATRINVTINGVPLNDGESQGVFWVDLPDFASSASDIQIVRGVGTSTNGAGAFGGTVSLNTEKNYQNNYIHANGTLGSFGTKKATFALGTGLINNKFTIDGRYSIIKSDGFIDRGAADLKSYYLGLGRITEKSSLKFITFSGSEVTYQAWNGVPEGKVVGDEQEIQDHFNRNKGFLYVTNQDSVNYFNSGRNYNFYQYENQEDDYTQSHYQLHHLLSLNENLTIKTTGFFTKGKGFFEQFRYQDNFSDYGIPPVNKDGDSIPTADTLIRRKWLDNNFFGGLFTAKYKLTNGSIQVGTAVTKYDGDHYGKVIYAQGFTRADVDRRYYDNTGTKNDFNAYVKYDQEIGKVGLFGDLQFRKVNHSILGETDDGANVDVDRAFTFIDPKIGLTYMLDKKQNVYGSMAIANREPDRNDILLVSDQVAKPERLTDIEFGYRYTGEKWKLSVNNYFMSYKDQLVLTGGLDDVGNSIRANVEKSHRLGSEISVTGEVAKNLFWNLKTTVSQNKISQFIEQIDDVVIEHSDTDISYSPSLIIGNSFFYKLYETIEIELSTKYVGKQYLDNTSNNGRSLDPYTYTNLRFGYDLNLPSIDGIKFTLQVNNLLDSKYSSNGYTYSYAAGPDLITENFLFPQAGLHFMLGAQVRL